MITKKHFTIVAEIIKEANNLKSTDSTNTFNALRFVAKQLANFFDGQNPRFDINRFMTACGFFVYEEPTLALTESEKKLTDGKCTFANCKEPQTENSNFCKEHEPAYMRATKPKQYETTTEQKSEPTGICANCGRDLYDTHCKHCFSIQKNKKNE
jgi:hypothetical protein